MADMNLSTSERLQADETLEYLAYRNYRANRLRFPETAPERYACVYPEWRKLEARFQAESERVNDRVMDLCDGNPAVEEVDLANHLIGDESGEVSAGLLMNLFIAVGTIFGLDLLYQLLHLVAKFPR